MSSNVWRLLALPCILGALLLIGSPEFPALHRAIEQAVAAAATPAVAEPPVPATTAAPEPSGRGVIIPLYASFAVLQALDVHSTLTALDRGAREGNPALAAAAGVPVAFIALKAGLGTAVILLAERVRRRSRMGAIVVMAAIDSAYAFVVRHNYAAAR